MRRAAFLDRDGTLIEATVRDGKPYPPSSVDDLIVLPGVPEALGRLRDAGFLLIVVTNQPDVARGTLPRDALDAMHRALQARLPIDDLRVCQHDDDDQCACRKPKPGLLLDAAREHGIDLSASVMIGDRWRDIDAGRNAGCRSVFIDYRYRETLRAQPDASVATFVEAADWVLTHFIARSETSRF